MTPQRSRKIIRRKLQIISNFEKEKKKKKNYREEQSNKIYKVRIRDTEIYECIL